MGKMIYAIISNTNQDKLNSLLSGMNSITGGKLDTVTFHEISAITCEIERVELIANQTNAIAFAGIIENLEQHFTLIPMRYGSMLESIQTIHTMLERNYSEFQQNLQKVENQSEFGLKVFCDSEILKEELKVKSETNNNSNPKSDPEIKKSIYLEYMDKKLKEHRLEEMVLSYVDKVIAEFSEKLTHLNAVTKIKKRTTTTILIDAVFLLKKDKKENLVQTVNELQSQYPELNFTLTGPWPPYNFVDVNLK